MNSAMLTELLCSLSIIGGLLLVGTFLRAKIKLFQKLFLPASVIGGFVGLLLGPMILGDYALLRVPEAYINNWSLLPGLLIVPIFAAVPLGMFMGEKKTAESSGHKTAPSVLKAFGIFAALGMVQSAVGFGTNMAFTAAGATNLYRTFGYELSQGFTGGHGTAGAVGKIFEGLGLDYWATAQGVATTTATVGLIGGVLIGILLINAAAQAGRTAILKKPGDIPVEMSRGFIMDQNRQPSLGRETTMNSSVETLSLHMAIILAGCGLAYLLMDALKSTGIAAFSNLPVWIYAMVIMFLINGLLIQLKLDWLIDNKVKSKLSGAMSDFAITAAIASMPVKAIMEFAVPITVMCVLGFAVTYFVIFGIQTRLFHDNYAFERGIIAWGCATGVMITGMMLLKICDPDYETPALSDFSVGFSLLSLSNMITQPIAISYLANGTTMENLVVSLLMAAVFFAVAYGAYAMERAGERRSVPAVAPLAE